MSKLDVRFEEIDKLDKMLAEVSTKRLHAIVAELKIDTSILEPSQALIFVESWARTLAQALR